MKKYIAFAISFVVLFLVLQIIMGYVATFLYVSNVNSAWYQAGELSEHTVIVGSTTFHVLLVAFIAASIAYLIPKKIKVENE